MLSYAVAAILLFSCSIDPPALPPVEQGPPAAVEPPENTPVLATFSPRDQSRIREATRHFIVLPNDEFWDVKVSIRAVEIERDEKVPARERAAYFGDDESKVTKLPMAFDPVYGRRISDPDELIELGFKPVQHVENTWQTFECWRILDHDSGTAIAFRYLNGRLDKLVVLENAGFQHDGQVLAPPVLEYRPPTKNLGSTYQTFRAHAAMPKLEPTYTKPTPEQLAIALRDGRAKLTEWRQARKPLPPPVKNAPRRGGPKYEIEWISKDVTPRPESRELKPASK